MSGESGDQIDARRFQIEELERKVADLEGTIQGRDMILKDWKRRAFEALGIIDELTPHVRALSEGPLEERVAKLRSDFPVPF